DFEGRERDLVWDRSRRALGFFLSGLAPFRFAGGAVGRADSAGGGGGQKLAKGRALEVAWRAAYGSVAQAVAHGAEPHNGAVQFIRLGRKQRAIDVRAAIG